MVTMNSGLTGAVTWLVPLLSALPGVGDLDALRISRFDDALSGLLAQHPSSVPGEPQARSQWLLRIRRELAAAGYLDLAVPVRDGGRGGPPVVQALMQFICGYHDADLRDATGLGHGRLISRHAAAPVRERWLPRLTAGDLPGIAMTEPHGGSQVHAIKTAATALPDGTWTVTGTKKWISRLNEAAVFSVFFKDPAGRLTAGVIDAADAGLERCPVPPCGLSGWAWGELRLHSVRLRPCDLLGRPGEGMILLRRHFAHYRPLVAATALGVAAAVHDMVAIQLGRRWSTGNISRPRDNALIALGSAYAQINAALLAVLTAQRLAESYDRRAETWGCAVKAHAVDVANTVVAALVPLAGAGGCAVGSPLEKAGRDLRALLYADGIHDSLYRAAGRRLLRLSGASQHLESAGNMCRNPRRH